MDIVLIYFSKTGDGILSKRCYAFAGSSCETMSDAALIYRNVFLWMKVPFSGAIVFTAFSTTQRILVMLVFSV